MVAAAGERGLIIEGGRVNPGKIEEKGAVHQEGTWCEQTIITAGVEAIGPS